VWKVCRAAGRDHHAAEDAFQATFPALARNGVGVRENVAGWLVPAPPRTAAANSVSMCSRTSAWMSSADTTGTPARAPRTWPR
jgi:hypothetical protein